ncbi:4100_t:CDS:2, partial [Funneliformis caledonium]
MTKNQNSKNSKNSPHCSQASTPLPNEGDQLQSSHNNIIDDNENRKPEIPASRNAQINVSMTPEEDEVNSWKEQVRFWQNQHNNFLVQVKKIREDMDRIKTENDALIFINKELRRMNDELMTEIQSPQFKDDNRFYKDCLPPNNAPDWACKPNDSTQETAPNRSQTPSARPVRTEIQSASTGSASTERTTLNVRLINPPPTRNYDDWINYNAEYEHQYRESSTTRMIRGAIQKAD